MKKIYLIALICFVTSAFSQNAQDVIDKLKKELSSNPDDKKTATIYSDLTWYYANVSIDSSLVYGSKAIKEAEKLKDSTLLAQIYSDLGAVHFRNTNYESSKKNYLMAYKIRKQIKDFAGLAKINNNLASIYNNTLHYKLAMKTYLEALNYFESKNDKENVSITQANLGQLYTKLRDFKDAVKYLNLAIKYAEKENLQDRLCENYLNLANTYRSFGYLEKAIEYSNIALKYCKTVGNKKATAMVYQSIAIANSKLNNDSISKVNVQKSLLVSEDFNSSIDNANLKLTVIANLIKENKFNDAYRMLIEVKKIFKKKNSEEDLLYTYKYLIPVHSNLFNHDSVSFYTEKYTALFEKTMQKEVSNQTLELETKYQTAKKEKLIAEQKEEAKYKNMMLLGLAIITLFIALFGYLIFRQQKLKNKQQEQEFELKSAISQIEKQNELQQQRLSISKDLHDNIGAQLTFIISSVETAKYVADIKNTTLETKLSNISNFTKDTIVELRDTIWAMNSETINFEDLRLRILNFIEKATTATTDISFNFMVDNALKNTQLSSVEGMNVYRCIQEAINNAIKYSEASTILVETNLDKNEIEINIKDNGKGFDVETISTGNGVQNMQKRMEEIDGTFQIVSEQTKGTLVTLNFKPS